MLVAIFCMPWNKKYGTEEMIARAFEALNWKVIKNEMASKYPDLVLIVGKGKDTADEKVIRNWRGMYPKTKYAYWYFDPIPLIELIYLSKAVDKTFVAQECMLNHLENAYHLPQAHDPLVIHPVETKKKYKYGFIGTYSPYREKELEKYEGIKIWGNGWPYPTVEPVFNEAFSKAVCQCEEMIQIPISKFYKENAPYKSAKEYMYDASQGKDTPTYINRIREMLGVLELPENGSKEGLYELNKQEVQQKL